MLKEELKTWAIGKQQHKIHLVQVMLTADETIHLYENFNGWQFEK